MLNIKNAGFPLKGRPCFFFVVFFCTYCSYFIHSFFCSLIIIKKKKSHLGAINVFSGGCKSTVFELCALILAFFFFLSFFYRQPDASRRYGFHVIHNVSL